MKTPSVIRLGLRLSAAALRRPGRLTPRPHAPLIPSVAQAADRDLVHRALSHDPAALDSLLQIVIPALHLRVAFVLRRRAPAAKGRNVRQEVEDIVQDVLLRLFAEEGRVLRDWDPDRGLSLDRFVGLVAERHIASLMRSQRRNPWMEDPTLSDLLTEREDEAPSVEVRIASREVCEVILDRLRERLSPLGLHLFYALVVEARDLERVSAETQLPKRALYNWKNRLLRVVQEIASELDEQPASAPRRAGAKP